MRRSCIQSGFVACLVVLLLAALSPESAEIRGFITFEPDGSPLPGVEVNATSEGARRRAYTGHDGEFRLIDLPQGTYELSAKLQGFTTWTLQNVRVPVAGTVTIDISMELRGPSSTYTWVIPNGGLREAYRSADAIVRLQITRSLEALAWPDPAAMNSVVGMEHVTIVLDVVKVDPVHGPEFGSELRFVQYPAGTWWAPGYRRAEGVETPYSPGEEYVAFLEWDPDFKHFTRFVGPVFMFPVRDGRVFWERDDLPAVPGFHDGMTVESFFAILHALPGETEE